MHAQRDHLVTVDRIGYLLISRNWAPDWLPGEGYVLASPNCCIASDQCPVVAALRMREGVR